tara:strand:+ start:1426 stop:1782 length:357 start_codon:yes stop_codon:yes gene_type:complete
MAHYAKVVNGIVETVIVAEAEFFDTFVDDSPGKWVQTSYNTRAGEHRLGGTPLRKNYAGIGFHYDGVGFYEPQPFPSWTLNSTTYQWECPVAFPNDGKFYNWNETDKKWDEVQATKDQ